MPFLEYLPLEVLDNVNHNISTHYFQISKHILQSALNYMSAAEEQQLKQHYGDVVKLYDKLKNISNACTCKEDTK